MIKGYICVEKDKVELKNVGILGPLTTLLAEWAVLTDFIFCKIGMGRQDKIEVLKTLLNHYLDTAKAEEAGENG